MMNISKTALIVLIALNFIWLQPARGLTVSRPCLEAESYFSEGGDETNHIWAGSWVTLELYVTGEYPITVQWLHNGTNTSRLYIFAATTNESGVYYALVSDANGTIVSSNLFLEVIQGPSVGEGLGLTNLVWSTTGDLQWHVNPDLPRRTPESGPAVLCNSPNMPWQDGNPGGALQTTVTGPATLSFWWMGDYGAEWEGWDYEHEGTFYLDDELRAALENLGPSSCNCYDWRHEVIMIPAGEHTVRWVHVDSSGGGTQIDSVKVIPPGTAPSVIAHPLTNLTIAQWKEATFRVEAEGTAPWTYQWMFNDKPLPGETNGSLTLKLLQPEQSGNYHVVVSNPYGTAISSNATVTVIPICIAWSGSFSYDYQIPLDLTNVVAISEMYALRSDGILVSFYDQEPYRPPTGLSNVSAIAVGEYHAVCLLDDGSVVAWPLNTGDPYGIKNIPAAATNVIAIAAGRFHTLILYRDGTVFSWGWSYSSATNVPAGLSNVTAIAAGDSVSLALKKDGTVLAWGFWGNASNLIATQFTNMQAIAANGAYFAGVYRDGTVRCAHYGGMSFWEITPPPEATNVMTVSISGTGRFLGLRRDGTIVIWPNRSSEDLPEGLRNVVAVSASSWYELALVGSPLRLTPAWRDGAFHLSCQGFSGWTYVLEHKENLFAPTWNVLGTLSGTATTREWTTNNPPQGFYRVRRE